MCQVARLGADCQMMGSPQVPPLWPRHLGLPQYPCLDLGLQPACPSLVSCTSWSRTASVPGRSTGIQLCVWWGVLVTLKADPSAPPARLTSFHPPQLATYPIILPASGVS